MSEQQKLTPEELEQLVSLQNQFTKLSREIGLLYIQKKLITDQFQILENHISTLDETRNAFIGDLQTKYGIGTVDINTGIITPES
jgi:hypothetical protein